MRGELKFEKASVPRGEFLGLGFERDVSGRESNLLFRLVVGSRGPAAVCQEPVTVS